MNGLEERYCGRIDGLPYDKHEEFTQSWNMYMTLKMLQEDYYYSSNYLKNQKTSKIWVVQSHIQTYQNRKYLLIRYLFRSQYI